MARAFTIDCYAVLEIQCSASPEEVKKAFHRLALLKHPDKNKNSPESTAAFQKILSDSSSRRLYDTERGTRARKAPETKAGEAPRTSAARCREENEKQRAAWRQWEKAQKTTIASLTDRQEKLKKLVAEKEALIANLVERLRKADSWVKYICPWDQLQPEARRDVEYELTQARAAATINTSLLQRIGNELGTAESEHERRRDAEAMRDAQQTAHIRSQERYEQYLAEMARRKAEEAAAAAAAAAERDRAARVYAEQARARQAAQEKAAQERAEAAAAAAEPAAAQERAAREGTKEARAPLFESETTASCKHRSYWAKVNRSAICQQCSRHQHLYHFRCPQCSSQACASCMRELKGTNGRKHRSQR